MSDIMPEDHAASPTGGPGRRDGVPAVGGAAVPTVRQRRRWIASFRRLLAGRLEALGSTVEEEIGKPAGEAMVAELLPLLIACRWHERNLRRVVGRRRLRGGTWWQLGQRHHVARAPLGRVAIIATWNYPVQLLGIQLVQAVAGGNTVVVKPSERSPASQSLLLELAREALREAGLDERLITWTESTREAGQALLLAERFDHIVFTGSTAVGKAIAELAAQSMTPTTLELSGGDSAIVLADADLRLAARSIWSAITLNAGQTCMAPRRILVEEPVYNSFLDALTPLAAAARPLPLIDDAAARECADLAAEAIAEGGRPLGGIDEVPTGRFLRPLAVADCPRDADLMDGAHFGPVLAIARVRDLTDALQVHHRSPRHLATSVFTRDLQRARSIAPMLGGATVCINDAVIPTAHPASSIGGRGESGWGASRGREGLLAMTRPVFVSTTARWPRTPFDAPHGAALRGLTRFITFLHGGRRTTSSTGRPARSAADRSPDSLHTSRHV